MKLAGPPRLRGLRRLVVELVPQKEFPGLVPDGLDRCVGLVGVPVNQVGSKFKPASKEGLTTIGALERDE